VWGVDTASRQDESAQIEATETLFEWVVRAVHSAPGAFADARWGSLKWTSPTERAFGLELRAELTFMQPIFDQPRDLVFPTTGAVSRAAYTPPTVPTSHGDT
jgi:hypothetical protein